MSGSGPHSDSIKFPQLCVRIWTTPKSTGYPKKSKSGPLFESIKLPYPCVQIYCPTLQNSHIQNILCFPHRKLLFSRPRYLWRRHVRLNTIMCSNANIENLLPNLHKIENTGQLRHTKKTPSTINFENYLSLFLTFWHSQKIYMDNIWCR